MVDTGRWKESGNDPTVTVLFIYWSFHIWAFSSDQLLSLSLSLFHIFQDNDEGFIYRTFVSQDQPFQIDTRDSLSRHYRFLSADSRHCTGTRYFLSSIKSAFLFINRMRKATFKFVRKPWSTVENEVGTRSLWPIDSPKRIAIWSIKILKKNLPASKWSRIILKLVRKRVAPQAMLIYNAIFVAPTCIIM